MSSAHLPKLPPVGAFVSFPVTTGDVNFDATGQVVEYSTWDHVADIYAAEAEGTKRRAYADTIRRDFSDVQRREVAAIVRAEPICQGGRVVASQGLLVGVWPATMTLLAETYDVLRN
jgi:hypothetical protein